LTNELIGASCTRTTNLIPDCLKIEIKDQKITTQKLRSIRHKTYIDNETLNEHLKIKHIKMPCSYQTINQKNTNHQ
jgi:hypothetical protein